MKPPMKQKDAMTVQWSSQLDSRAQRTTDTPDHHPCHHGTTDTLDHPEPRAPHHSLGISTMRSRSAEMDTDAPKFAGTCPIAVTRGVHSTFRRTPQSAYPCQQLHPFSTTTTTNMPIVNSTGGSGGPPLQQPLQQLPRADNPGVQTADGFGPARAPGQPQADSEVQQLRRQLAANTVSICRALGRLQPGGLVPRAGSPHVLRPSQPVSDLVRLHPSNRLALHRRRSA